MKRGYVRLWRKILENPLIMKDSDHFAIYSYLLLHATHKERETLLNGKPVRLSPGQIITGSLKIADDLKISRSKVERVLKALEIGQQIGQQTTTGGRLITIVSWGVYSKSGQQNGQRPDNDRTTTGQRPDTIQECKELKNVKNEREGRPGVEIPFDVFLKDFARASNGKKCPFFFTETAKLKLTRIFNTLIEQGAKNPTAAIQAVIAQAMGEMLAWIEKNHSDQTPIYYEPDSIFEEKQFSRYLSKAKPKGKEANDQTITN